MLVVLTSADGVLIDLRYAGADNLTGQPIYRRPVAMLHPQARGMLLAAVDRARRLDLRLCILDAFRPIEAQQALWDALPDPRFVSDPRLGGTHPRGAAVDLTLCGPDGAELPMGTGFDDMTERAAHGFLDLPQACLHARALLLGIMVASGWQPYAPEWWHYQVPGCEEWPVLRAADVPDGPMPA